ncbi:uncharacterized protein [Primulina huaijiensis]|uniref:uncharacterized protein n=1 Tax=Primulina huaijiensis TaxID=1492673 RepID=UPI003CC78687
MYLINFKKRQCFPSDRKIFAKFRKCKFLLEKVTFLGHFISISGIEVDLSKGFYSITMPLNSLTKKNVKFVWSADCPKIFDTLKQAIITALVLAMPSGQVNFVLYTDYSNLGLDTVLMHHGRVIAYASRKLKGKANVVADALSRKVGVMSQLSSFDEQLYKWQSRDESKGRKLYAVSDGILRYIEIIWYLEMIPLEEIYWQKRLQQYIPFIQGVPRCEDKTSESSKDAQTSSDPRVEMGEHYHGFHSRFAEEIDRLLEIPVTIVFDRGSKFMSSFWKSLNSAMGTKLLFSTVFNPHTDGQSERVIKILEDLLRACVIDFHENWESKLSLVEFTYNNSFQSYISMAFYKSLYGKKCRSPIQYDEVCERSEFGLEIVQQTVDVVVKIQDKMKTT